MTCISAITHVGKR